MNELASVTSPSSHTVTADPVTRGSLRAEFESLTRLLVEASSHACLIEWRGTAGHGVARQAVSDPWNTGLTEIFSAISRRDSKFPSQTSLSPAELRALLPRRHREWTESTQALIARADASSVTVTVVALFPSDAASAVIGTMLQLTASHALAIVARQDAAASREFWRERAIQNGERLARAISERRSAEMERQRLDRVIATITRLKPRNRLSGLGSNLARVGAFDVWLVANISDDMRQVVAASAMLVPFPVLGRNSALAEAHRQQAVIVRSLTATSAIAYDEDRLFAAFRSYLCLPLARIAVAFASRDEIDAATVAWAEMLATRINPIVSIWDWEAENQRLLALVRNLGLRMFGAIDAERARIARDLHDHQAQLLAAARIAIEAGPEEARGIFKQLEEALRLRVRELRPATLGRSSLAEALRYELRRLADTGIKTRLVPADKLPALTRPVQQLYYQVAREALFNVARHSDATRVEIRIEKRADRTRLTIHDNGKGLDERAHRGMGLSGLTERLQMMGGRLRFESRPGATRLIAEVPETA
ncbi:MAG: sensor histidine kinase [Candidatus Binataceae bacterium]